MFDNIVIIFFLFIIIIISSVYYPLFYVEYFTLLDNKYNIEDCEQLKDIISDKKKESIVNNLYYLEKNTEKINNFNPIEVDNNLSLTGMIENEEFNHSCCPSEYTSSNGCLCSSPELLSHIELRGNNKRNCF